MGSSSSTQQKQQPEPTTPQTSTQKKPHIVTKTNQQFLFSNFRPQTKQTQQSSQLITDKEITNIVESIGQKSKNSQKFLAEEWCQIIEKEIQNNSFLRQYREQKRQFDKQFIVPFKANYNKIPKQLTAFKFTYLNSYDYNDRLVALGLLSMLIGVRSFRKAFIYQLPLRTFSAVKDSAVAYFLAGLLIAPEIYNPLMTQ